MSVKKVLKRYAKRDKQKILESDESKTILQKLLSKIAQQNQVVDNKKVVCLCPDCGNELLFNLKYRRFMHENCEQLNCWYAANELGECVDNNEMRAARIREFNKQN